MTMTSQFIDMASFSAFFLGCCVFFVKFTYWSKFCVNIITGSGVMNIFVYKFGTNVSNKKLRHAAELHS